MKTHRYFIAIFLAIFLAGCSISENLEDGYQAGDIAEGTIENYRFYCSAPFVGLRAVGRVFIALLGGVTVPDTCKLIDEIREQKSAWVVGIGDFHSKKVLPSTSRHTGRKHAELL